MNLRNPGLGRRELVAGFSALALLLALVIGVTNCGGGSGGGDGDDDTSSPTNYTGSDETVTVDEDNGSTAAGAGVDSFSASAGTTATGSGIAGGASLETAKQTKGLAATALEAYRKSQEHGLLTERNQVAGVVESCPDGGDISVTWDTVDGEDNLDAQGDEVSLNFDSCQIGTTTYDGGFVLTLKGIDTTTGNRDLRMAFDNLLVSQNDSPQIGANGALRFKTGTFADKFPHEGGHASFSQAGNQTDQQFTVGSDGPLEIVDHTSDWVSKTTDLNYYLGDGNDDGGVDYSQDWYLVIHGDPAEICTTSLDGCINVNHDDTTGFTFYKEDYDDYPYPSVGVFRVDGNNGSYAKVNADTGDVYTVYLTVYDGTQFVIGPDSEEQWSLLSNRDFSSSL